MVNCRKCTNSFEPKEILSSGWCVLCDRAYRKEWRAANKEKVLKYNTHARTMYPEKLQDSCKKWRVKQGTVKLKELSHKYYSKNVEEKRNKAVLKFHSADKEHIKKIRKVYRKVKAAKITALNRKRELLIKKATPSWLTKEDFAKIETVYEKARWLETITGLKYHVDHVIPIKGKNVCGLHVWENLQLLEVSVNLKKHNKFLGV